MTLIVIRAGTTMHVRYQSAPGHSSRRVSGNWLARVMRHSSVRAPLASSFFPETGGTFLRGVVNSFGPFEAARTLIPRIKFCQEPSRGLSKCFRRLSLVVVHVTQHDRRTRQSAVKE